MLPDDRTLAMQVKRTWRGKRALTELMATAVCALDGPLDGLTTAARACVGRDPIGWAPLLVGVTLSDVLPCLFFASLAGALSEHGYLFDAACRVRSHCMGPLHAYT